MAVRQKFIGLKIVAFLFFTGSGYWFVREVRKLVPAPVPAASAADTTARAADPAGDSCLQLLHSGDILLRTGNDEISNVFRHLNTRDQTYSHAGLVFIEQGKAFVYHSIGGADNPEGRLQKEPVRSFIRPEHNLGWGIVRLDMDTATLQALQVVVDSLYHSKVRFDDDFDLRSDDRLYCTEFVYKCVIRASRDSSFLPLTVHHNTRYVAVDDLFNNKHAQTICQLRYK